MTETRTTIDAEFTESEKIILANAIRTIRRKDVFSFADKGTRNRLAEIFARLQQALEFETPKHW